MEHLTKSHTAPLPDDHLKSGANGELLHHETPHVIDHGHSHVPIRYQPRSGLRIGIFAIVVILGLGAIFFYGYRVRHHEHAVLADEVARDSNAPVPVDIVHVKAGSLETELTLPGEAHGFSETVIFARTSGYLSKWLVEIGEHVKEGQTLATIETPELDDQLVAAQARVDQLKAEVLVAETTQKFAQLSADRWTAATPEGAVSKQESDQKLSELESSKAKSISAKAQVALGLAEVQRLMTMQKFKNVVAPFDGTITRRYVDIGDLVTAGSTTSTGPLFKIVQAEKIRVVVNVPQAAAADLKVGTLVSIKTREGKGQTFTGHLDYTAEAVDTDSRTLRVEVVVPNQQRALRPGSYLQATFHTTRQNPPLEVPAAAIDFRPTGPQVAVVSADGRITFREVKIENDMGDRLEVDGLKDGEAVALNIGSQISEGQKVEAHDLDTPAMAVVPGASASSAARAELPR